MNDDAYDGTPVAARIPGSKPTSRLCWAVHSSSKMACSSSCSTKANSPISQTSGRHVAEVLVGPKVRQGYRSTTFYQHESTPRLVLQAVGVSRLPGNAANVAPMGEFLPTKVSATGSGIFCTASPAACGNRQTPPSRLAVLNHIALERA